MRGIFVIILLICSLSVYGQTEKRPLWKIQLEGALDNYSRWEVEPSVTFQPFKYAGIGVSFLFSKVWMTSISMESLLTKIPL